MDSSNPGDYIPAGECTAEEFGFNSGTRTLTNYVEAVRASTTLADKRILFEVDPDERTPPNFIAADAVKLTVLKVDIVPDFNHDRVIDETDKSLISTNGPFRFWINDDDDDGDEATGDSDLPGHWSWGTSPADFSNNKVDGRCDLLDFTPVWLDLSQVLSIFPPSSTVQYKLKQADEAVAIVYTDLKKTQAGDFLTTEGSVYGAAFAQNSFDATTIKITAAGIDLDDNFLNEIIADSGKGVLLMEGRKTSGAPLVLEIWKDGVKVFEKEMPLSISDVEKMYRWINLRNVTGGSESISTLSGDPFNRPDTTCSSKQVVFLHGFNVTEKEGRAAVSEVFKRFCQSGSRAMFTGVTWQGDEQGWFSPIPASAFFHLDVINAFQVAASCAMAVNALPGQKYVMAHSLGNMVVSSTIVDHGLNPQNYFMLDAAVAMESYDSSEQQPSLMMPPDWGGYTNRLWASEWYHLFDPTDGRRKLTWKNRFGGLVNTINYYSAGEDILDNNEPYMAPTFPDLSGNKAWVYGEMVKGCWQLAALPTVEMHGGWGFNDSTATGYGTNVWNGSGWDWRLLSFAAAAALPDVTIRTNSFFRHFYDDNLYKPAGSALATNLNIRAKILGGGVPATSWALGRNKIDSWGALRNVDMTLLKRPGSSNWPAGRPNSRWLHGDFKVVAYPFIYPLFDDLVEKGGFRE